MRFKAGDKVRVSERLHEIDKVVAGKGKERITTSVEPEMKNMANEEVTISEVGNYSYSIHELPYFSWTDEMFEPLDPLTTKIEERNNKTKPYTPMTIEEHNEAHLGEPHDPIKPAHYRKGEIDLYESWYRTYPFNEFRAGMQMIAERYMKRDKDNRIQDLNKAIYTLNRLKEYEELEE